MHASHYKLQSGNCCFGRCFAEFEYFSVIHVGDQLLRYLAELVDLLRLLEVLKEGVLVLELLNQLFDIVFAIFILLFNCRNKYIRNSVIHGVVPGLPGTL